MRVQDVMSRPAITVLPSMSIRQAATVLLRCQVTAMPVVDEDGAVVGMVSEADLLGWFAPSLSSNDDTDTAAEPAPLAPVVDVMSTPAICVSRWARLGDAAQQMRTADVRSLPVVDGSRVVGIVSRSDLLHAAFHDDDAIAAELRRRLTVYFGRAEAWQVTVLDGAISVRGDFHDDTERQVITALARTVPGAHHVATIPEIHFR